jgi:hypothetical protein
MISWDQVSVCRDPEASVCQGLAVSACRGPEGSVYQDRSVSTYRDLAALACRGLAVSPCQGLAVWAYPDPGVCQGLGSGAYLGLVTVRPRPCPPLALPHRQPKSRRLQ